MIDGFLSFFLTAGALSLPVLVGVLFSDNYRSSWFSVPP